MNYVVALNPSCTKVSFKTKSDARRAAKRGESELRGVRFRIYRCSTCHYWHLTKRR